MKISEELIRRLNEISQMRYPNEACGVLIGNNSNGQVESIWELENILESTHNFQIDSFDYLKVEKWAIARGKDIIGFFHSHPNAAAVPSLKDSQYMLPRLNYIISSVDKTGVRQLKAYRKNSVDEDVTEIIYKVG